MRTDGQEFQYSDVMTGNFWADVIHEPLLKRAVRRTIERTGARTIAMDAGRPFDPFRLWLIREIGEVWRSGVTDVDMELIVNRAAKDTFYAELQRACRYAPVVAVIDNLQEPVPSFYAQPELRLTRSKLERRMHRLGFSLLYAETVDVVYRRWIEKTPGFAKPLVAKITIAVDLMLSGRAPLRMSRHAVMVFRRNRE